jgi:hypothetical protein
VTDTQRTTPEQWLVAQASAVLESVAAANVTCYGRRGVPHYPVPTPAQQQPDPPVMCAELHLTGADGTTRLALLDLDLIRTAQTDQQAIWQLYDTTRQMQIIWVWDFFRIQSHVVLRVGLPPADHTPESAWQSALEALRAMQSGDRITLKVQSTCANIHQQHTLTAAPTAWSPG